MSFNEMSLFNMMNTSLFDIKEKEREKKKVKNEKKRNMTFP